MSDWSGLNWKLVTWHSGITFGFIVGMIITQHFAGVLPQFPFTEHYQCLLVSLSLGIVSKEAFPFLASILYGIGMPPFIQEFFQTNPFDLGSWQIVASLPLTFFLIWILRKVARQHGIKSPVELIREIFLPSFS